MLRQCSLVDCGYYACREKHPSRGELHETEGALVWFASNQRIVDVVEDKFRDD